MKKISLQIAGLAALLGVVGLLSGMSQAGESGNGGGVTAEQGQAIVANVGRSVVVDAPWPTIRVSITNPEVADVQVLTPTQVLVQAKGVGTTDLILWSEGETEYRQMQVEVQADLSGLKEELGNLFSDADLELTQSGEVLVVRGVLRRAEDVERLHRYLEASGLTYVDMTSLAGVQQVQIDVRVAEVSRVAFRSLAMNAFHTNNGFFGASRVGSSTGGALAPSINVGPPAGTAAGSNLPFIFPENVSASPLVTVFAGFPDADLQLFLQALAENQYLRILANPTLVALSGEEASFLAGGEFPIPVVQSTAGGSAGTSITVEYREFGVRLRFRPLVLGDGTMRLRVEPEVSELTDIGAVEIEGFQIPAISTRKSQTTVELKNGQTFALAGLLREQVDARTSRVPGIGELPIIGALFRSTRYVSEETELVVLVTAHLVEPLNVGPGPLPGSLDKAPNDWEFYSEGRIHGEEPARLSDQEMAWLKEAGLEALVGPGAWEDYETPAASSEASLHEEAAEAGGGESEDK